MGNADFTAENAESAENIRNRKDKEMDKMEATTAIVAVAINNGLIVEGDDPIAYVTNLIEAVWNKLAELEVEDNIE